MNLTRWASIFTVTAALTTGPALSAADAAPSNGPQAKMEVHKKRPTGKKPPKKPQKPKPHA
jgi:hypothetical protein